MDQRKNLQYLFTYTFFLRESKGELLPSSLSHASLYLPYSPTVMEWTRPRHKPPRTFQQANKGRKGKHLDV